MKTVLFATSYINSERHLQRYREWLAYYTERLNKLGAGNIFLIDDGSPLEWLLQLGIPIIRIDKVTDGIFPKVQEGGAAIFRFPENLGRPQTTVIPGWWRSFSFVSFLAYFYTVDKLIHIESDTYILSDRMFYWLKSTRNRWAVPRSKHYGFPDPCIQIIPNYSTDYIDFPSKPHSNFKVLFDYFNKGEMFWFKNGELNKNYIPEYCLPFDEITEQFEGDRYGEDWCETIPEKADYISNITDISLNGMNHQNIESKQEAIRRLIYETDNSFPDIPRKTDARAFHSGDMGDIVYAIPTMKALNVKTLYLNPEPWYGTKVGEEQIKFLTPLIESAGIEVRTAKCGVLPLDYDLDAFRYVNLDLVFEHLAEVHAIPHAVVPDFSEPWLSCDLPYTAADVVINCSERYKADYMDWTAACSVIEEENASAVYIGTIHEYKRFLRNNQQLYGKLEFCPVEDAYAIMRVLAGAKVFIGNQSLPYSIAEGMKVDRILAVCTWVPNCSPFTSNAVAVDCPEKMFEALEFLRSRLHE